MTDSQPKDKRLSEISSHYDIGEKGFLNDEEKQVRAMDINGKGAVSADFAVKLATENSNFLRQIQKLNTRQLIMYAIVFTCCVATITSSIVGAERAKDTMINDQGDFVSKFNGAPVATSEALQDIGSIGFTEMTNDKLADLKYISFGENTVHLAVKGHLRNKDSSVTLLIEGGTLTFDNEELISSTGETGALLETALGYSLIENAGERRLAFRKIYGGVGWVGFFIPHLFGLSSPVECPVEQGFCVLANGVDQNSGVLQINSVDGDTMAAQKECLTACHNHGGATGCEVIWDQYNRGCYIHTAAVDHGNNYGNHKCWVFSKCS